MATNLAFHEHTKHIEVDCDSIREVVDTKVIYLLHIFADLRIIDVFISSWKSDASSSLNVNLRKELLVWTISLESIISI
jgi:hypothetical protein